MAVIRGRERKSGGEIFTASMADIVFLLIVFFVLTYKTDVDRTQVDLVDCVIAFNEAQDGGGAGREAQRVAQSAQVVGVLLPQRGHFGGRHLRRRNPYWGRHTPRCDAHRHTYCHTPGYTSQ